MDVTGPEIVTAAVSALDVAKSVVAVPDIAEVAKGATDALKTDAVVLQQTALTPSTTILGTLSVAIFT